MINYQRIIAGIILIVLFGALLVPMNAQAQAEVPEWEEGDSWAMGYEMDIEEFFAPGLDDIKDEMETDIGQQEEFEDFDFEFYGSAESYTYLEVIEETDEQYILEIQSQTEFNVGGNFELTGQLPKEGESAEDYDPETEERTISGNGDLEFVQTMSGEATFEKSDLALESLEIDIEISIDGTVVLNDVPDMEAIEEEGIFEYTDYDGSVDLSFQLSMDYTFDPALDLFDFPIEEGSWEVSSEMTVSGTYEGMFDVNGLPDFMEEQIETELGTELPMIFEDHELEESEEIGDGVIEETSEEITIPMKCTGTDEVVLYDGETTEVYLLEFDIPDPEDPYTTEQETPGFVMKYSPEHGNIVSAQGSFVDSPMTEYMTEDTMEMELVDRSTAANNIDAVEGDGEDDGSIPFISANMILIAVIAAVMISTVLKKNKKDNNTTKGNTERQ
ncbi:MAG: hypothetical protein R6W73_00805 [Candidatus Saliniplasma sp.]